MREESLTRIEAEIGQLQRSLSSIDEARRTLVAQEAELTEEQRASMRPIQNLQLYPLSAQDEDIRQSLMRAISHIGVLIEEWGDEQRERLKRQERQIEEELQELSNERQKLLIQQEEKKKKEQKDGKNGSAVI